MTASHGIQPHPTDPGKWVLYRISKLGNWYYAATIFAGTDPVSAQRRVIALLEQRRFPHGSRWMRAPNKPNTWGLLYE